MLFKQKATFGCSGEWDLTSIWRARCVQRPQRLQEAHDAVEVSANSPVLGAVEHLINEKRPLVHWRRHMPPTMLLQETRNVVLTSGNIRVLGAAGPSLI